MSVNTTHFTSPLTQYEAEAFCARWLPAWTGNRPEALLEFYARDAYYADPAVPDGRSQVAPGVARWSDHAPECVRMSRPPPARPCPVPGAGPV